MNKYILRVLVGLIAFVIGVSAFWFLVSEIRFRNYRNSNLKTVSDVKNEQKDKNLIGKIEVRFNRFAKNKNGTFAEFNIQNNTEELISYSSYSLTNSKSEISPIFKTKINEKEIVEWVCGTGLMPYQIKSGEFKTFNVEISSISYHWEKGKSVQIGFSFKKVSEEEFKTFWSEKLPITDEIEKELLKEKREFEKLAK